MLSDKGSAVVDKPDDADSKKNISLEEKQDMKKRLSHVKFNKNPQTRGPGWCAKICCCLCFCPEKESGIVLRNSSLRWGKMQGKNKRGRSSTKSEEDLYDTLQILEDLYSNKSEVALSKLKACRLNPDYDHSQLIRNDLEFYIPQLINLIIFHEELRDERLNEFLENACNLNFFFGHLVYWCLNSTSKIKSKDPEEEQFSRAMKDVASIILQSCNEGSENKYLLAFSELEQILKQAPRQSESIELHDRASSLIREYGTNPGWNIRNLNLAIKPVDIPLNNYFSIQRKGEEGHNGFLSTISFFNDLIEASEKLAKTKKDARMEFLKEELRKINVRLPAAVYVPFFNNSIRNYAVLKIVVEETKIFSTKERAPYYICLEIFRPEEGDYEAALEHQKSKQRNKESKPDFHIFDLRLSSPQTVNKTSKDKQKKLLITEKNIGFFSQRSHSLSEPFKTSRDVLDDSHMSNTSSSLTDRKLLNQDIELSIKEGMTGVKQKEGNPDKAKRSSSQTSSSSKDSGGISCIYGGKMKKNREKNLDHYIKNSVDKSLNMGDENSVNKAESEDSEIGSPDSKKEVTKQLQDKLMKDISSAPGKTSSNSAEIKSEKPADVTRLIFGENSAEQSEKIKANSPFQSLKSWSLVHLIVKTEDNLKQEQFALQIIYQFDQIFKSEKLKLKLRPYEVLSLGPSSGIIEMVKDAVTIDRLKYIMHTHYRELNGLDQIFNFVYARDIARARENFCQSLAAYCLVTYFLQVKDRHNGNILLTREGCLLHIDFGFFLSNMPGKGLEFEKNVPFKLLTEYVDVLGGPTSHLFGRFRKLFYKGFKAVRRHQDKIILLIKMMYSSHAKTLPCFSTDERCIEELIQRFNPPNVKDDGDLNIFTQGLINQSLDNIRTRWYDKFQYYCQGIFY